MKETAGNIFDLLSARVNAAPEKIFLISEADGREWTYEEFRSAVTGTAAVLRENGIVKGDVVSLLMPNSAEYVIAYFACWMIGALAGPINSLLKPEEIEWATQNSESKLLIANSTMLGSLDTIEKPTVLVFDDVARFVPSDRKELEQEASLPDDEAIIIYTSGTTGRPKGCLLTHGNLIANSQQIAEWLGFGPNDRLLSVMPLFHMNAVTVTTMTALYCGGSTVVSPKFSASRFWDIIERFEITSFGSVATMLSMLLATRGQQSAFDGPKCESLRFAMCGSAPVPAEVLKRFEETFACLVIEGYGLSESTCRSSFNPPNETRRVGSCGIPIGNEMKIFDESDAEVPVGELGEIVLRGPNIFKGYFKNSEATQKAFENGWFHTGDIGFCDDDGFFYIADRKSDMIIRGGENIYPREIDDLLYTHPAIASAAVIGVPDDLYGEEVAAFVVLKDGFEASSPYKGGVAKRRDGSFVSAEEIIEFCKLRLADYKCPKTVHFVEDIPKGPTGKLLKRELAKMYRSGNARSQS